MSSPKESTIHIYLNSLAIFMLSRGFQSACKRTRCDCFQLGQIQNSPKPLNMVNIIECKSRPHIFNTWSLSPKRSFWNVMCKSQDIDWQSAKDVSSSCLPSIKWSHLMWVCSSSPSPELTTIKTRTQHLFLQISYIGVLRSSMVMMLVWLSEIKTVLSHQAGPHLGWVSVLREELPEKEARVHVTSTNCFTRIFISENFHQVE